MSDHRDIASTACGHIDNWIKRGFSARHMQDILLIMQAHVTVQFAREQVGILPPPAKDE